MIQKHKFVEKNLKMLQTLTKSGYVSPKLLNYYDIYRTYEAVKDKNTMDSYKKVAGIMKRVSPRTVRQAVCDMKKYIKD